MDDLNESSRIGIFPLSGKDAALPPRPPLRTERESFPSFGSSRYKALREQGRFTREIPACP